MTLDVDLVARLLITPPPESWEIIVAKAIETTRRPLTVANGSSEITRRDREIGSIDHFLSTCGWELWQSFGDSVERTSDRLARWWKEPYGAKAVLILDGLSLRELPWLLQGANARGFTVHGVTATASEIPGDTNEFARALGFNSRSHLQANGAGSSHSFSSASTESVDLPWHDCAALVTASHNWVFWHHWPDSKIHDGSGAGPGLDALTRNVAEQLSGDAFWEFVDRLATGRRLVITSDHGYAATGLFPDADGDVGQHLKKIFASGRGVAGASDVGGFVPPVALQIASPHGGYTLALGRWKWKSQGGYPTLAHGGLSLLEVLSPFVEITK